MPPSALGCLPVISKIKGLHGAVRVLNSLQSNVLDRLRKKQDNPECQLLDMYTFLSRTGLTVHELDKLNIIHVTGTKGKGSTCAFTERILRNHGLRTGFYSSPHLVHVRERIRINGQPISKDLFTKYFWDVYEQLAVTKDDHGGSMPFYFQFLTLMAFHVFLLERVDLAVIEVGIGGQYDCTNIVRKPWVCGISSLGIDHASLLGQTVEKIAWQKAGIFKPGVPAFTVRQPPGPLSVLQDRAEEIGCPLRVCPELEEYDSKGPPLCLGLAGQHQRGNASLALQLSHSWLQRQKAEQTDGFHSTPTAAEHRLGSQATAFQPGRTMLKGLQETEWLGRSQTVRHGPVSYCIDGAHTTDSIQACARWFTQEMQRSRGMRVLLFNTTGDRDSAALLKLLVPCQFDYAVFCPNVTETHTNTTVSSPTVQANWSTPAEQALARCLDNQNSWLSLSAPEEEAQKSPEELPIDQQPNHHHHHRPHQRHLVANSGTRALVFPCILSALQWISQGRDPVLAPPGVPAAVQSTDWAEALRDAPHISVLVTGSLYLVGGVLQHLVPSLDSS